MNDKIKALEAQIQAEKRAMEKCTHVWGDVFSNPEVKSVEYLTGEYEVSGIHHHPITSYRDQTVPRWTRECELCGYKEHTYTEKPIISGFEPNF